nr:hypothetical protein CFP56_12026 [Quercus suber]
MVSSKDQLCKNLERLQLGDSALILGGVSATAPSDKKSKSSTPVRPRHAEIPIFQPGNSNSTPRHDHTQYHMARCPAVDLNNIPCSLPVHSTGYELGIADGDALPYHVVQDPIVGMKIVYGRRQEDSRRDSGTNEARLDDDERHDLGSADSHIPEHKLAWEEIRNVEFTNANIRDSSVQNCVAAGSIAGRVACWFQRCDLTFSTLEACQVWASTLQDCDTTGSLLVDVTITRGTLRYCSLDNCKLEGDVQIGPGVFGRNLSHLACGLEISYTVSADGVLR